MTACGSTHVRAALGRMTANAVDVTAATTARAAAAINAVRRRFVPDGFGSSLIDSTTTSARNRLPTRWLAAGGADD